MFVQTALIQSAAAQRRHFDAARLDTAPEAPLIDPQHVPAQDATHRVRRSFADLLFRAARAVAPSAPGAGRPAAG